MSQIPQIELLTPEENTLTTILTNQSRNGSQGRRMSRQLSRQMSRRMSQLEPTDGGRHAWQVLLSAFVFEALFWGFPTAFGVFQAYYSSLPEFATDVNNITTIGTVAQGLIGLCAPFAAAATKAFPRYRREMILLGWALCILGLLAASFANSVAVLIATQGVLYGVGFVTFTYPILEILNEWWIVRKGMAFGLISSASGITGTGMPLILNALLQRYGYKVTLRACAVGIGLATGPLIFLLKGRLPSTDIAQRSRTDWSFLRKALFWFYALAVTMQGFGYFIPPVFIVSYGMSIGLSSTQATCLLVAMAVAQTVGQFTFGWLSDKSVHVSLLACICCIAAGAASAVCWGLAKSLPLLVVFSILYGFFAYGFSTMRVGMGRAVSSEQSAVLATYSIFVFLQGIGFMVTGPITASLISSQINTSFYGIARYRWVVIFAAATSLFSAVLITTPHLLRIEKYKLYGIRLR